MWDKFNKRTLRALFRDGGSNLNGWLMHCWANFLTPVLPFKHPVHQLLHLVWEQLMSTAVVLSAWSNQVTEKKQKKNRKKSWKAKQGDDVDVDVERIRKEYEKHLIISLCQRILNSDWMEGSDSSFSYKINHRLIYIICYCFYSNSRRLNWRVGYVREDPPHLVYVNNNRLNWMVPVLFAPLDEVIKNCMSIDKFSSLCVI